MLLIALLAEHCPWKHVEWLSEIQMLPRDGKPLARRSKAIQDGIFAEIADLIADYFENFNKQK